jgi:signal transduction histidine kinase
MSLQSRLFVLVIAAIFPILCVGAFSQSRHRETRLAEQHEQTLRHARLIAAELDRVVDGAHQLVMSLAELPTVRRGDADCGETLGRLLDRFSRYVQLGVADLSGNTYCFGGPPSAGSIADRAWFRSAVETGELSVGGFVQGRSTGLNSMHFAYPIRGADEKISGVVAVALSLDWLADHLDAKPQLPHSTVTVADRDGTIVFRSPDAAGWVGRTLPRQRLRDTAASEPRTVESTGFDGVRKIVGFVPLGVGATSAFDVGVGVPVASVMAALDRAVLLDAAMIVAGVFAALLAAGFVGRIFFRRPIERLMVVIGRWQTGDRSPRVASTGKDEISRLGAAFDDVAVSLQRRERELIAARDAAETANRAKTSFLATMSHELRTPLNAILGFSEILRDGHFGPIAPRYAAYAGDIHASGRHLLKVINDILDLSKIEAGRQKIAHEPVDLCAVARASCQLLQEKAKAAGIAMEIDLPGDAILVGDQTRLKQISLNLLSNAIKFTPPGGKVRLAVIVRPRATTLEVTDDGIGMTAEEVAIALEPFGQVESSFTRSYDGTGLGLPLVKGLAALHGGRLEIESTKDAGTTVRVVLPAAPLALAA